ncbi:MAG: N(4)-(beta-N-acetylglucosaminyl)-L-asparaginase [Rhodothermales bacterium]|nr:N(4)-(beta-N-acetylglucosaminyl)-L-asparaginase [Rhodothermales bacterium]MBO6779773.1 N(4)-(beta-N-acetylglucosaminyl)-L-asparaginase [Rhodothermales bacterium]
MAALRPRSRREFLKTAAVGGAATAVVPACVQAASEGPVAIATWNHGQDANAAAWPMLMDGASALDAVEAGVRVPEADPTVTTVGYGGAPDRDGNVTLDACIMDHDGRCGSVAFLQEIKHPISVARQVMERTPHVMLVGAGAQEFAVANGFERENLLTPESEVAWREWQAEQGPERPPINVENHDTIGMLTLDRQGRLAGACTTSGAAYKYHGRVGDSPIIGAGLYVDGAVGGATSTGWGEAVIRSVGCFLVVELMRQGHSPQRACELAVERVIEKNPDWREIQVGFLALNTAGDYGAYCIAPGFNFAVQSPSHDNVLMDSGSALG